MSKRKLDFEQFTRLRDDGGSAVATVTAESNNRFLVVVRIYSVPVATLSRMFCLLESSGFISRNPYEAECEKNKPHFIKFMLERRTAERELGLFVECITQSRVVNSIIVCDMTDN